MKYTYICQMNLKGKRIKISTQELIYKGYINLAMNITLHLYQAAISVIRVVLCHLHEL